MQLRWKLSLFHESKLLYIEELIFFPDKISGDTMRRRSQQESCKGSHQPLRNSAHQKLFVCRFQGIFLVTRLSQNVLRQLFLTEKKI